MTVHLREDRRHIRDADLDALLESLTIPLNLECSAVGSMIRIAGVSSSACVLLGPGAPRGVDHGGRTRCGSERSRLSDGCVGSS